jgi:hypothetical protein
MNHRSSGIRRLGTGPVATRRGLVADLMKRTKAARTPPIGALRLAALVAASLNGIDSAAAAQCTQQDAPKPIGPT